MFRNEFPITLEICFTVCISKPERGYCCYTVSEKVGLADSTICMRVNRVVLDCESVSLPVASPTIYEMWAASLAVC